MSYWKNLTIRNPHYVTEKRASPTLTTLWPCRSNKSLELDSLSPGKVPTRKGRNEHLEMALSSPPHQPSIISMTNIPLIPHWLPHQLQRDNERSCPSASGSLTSHQLLLWCHPSSTAGSFLSTSPLVQGNYTKMFHISENILGPNSPTPSSWFLLTLTPPTHTHSACPAGPGAPPVPSAYCSCLSR